MDWLLFWYCLGWLVIGFIVGYTVGKIQRMVRSRNCEALAKFLEERRVALESKKASRSESLEGD